MVDQKELQRKNHELIRKIGARAATTEKGKGTCCYGLRAQVGKT
jgi:hypothetical protein